MPMPIREAYVDEQFSYDDTYLLHNVAFFLLVNQ